MMDRRMGFRIPFAGSLISYVADRPLIGLISDLSDSGIGWQATSRRAPALGTRLALELPMAAMRETIWAHAEVCYRAPIGATTQLGVRFLAMANVHARALRDYCQTTRTAHLDTLLARIRA